MRRFALSLLLACGPAAQPTPQAPGALVPAPLQPTTSGRPSGARDPSVSQGPRPVITRLSHGADASSCGLDVDGAIWCWNTMTFERDVAVGRDATFLSRGSGHGCVVDARGGATCWGSNYFGELGDQKPVQYRDAVASVPGLPPVAEISAQSGRTCARTVAGAVSCWGDRSWGKAGDGTLIEESRDAGKKLSVSGTIVTGAISIASGSSHSCAALGDGTVRCWGGNLSGQGGTLHANPPTPRPTAVPHATGVVALAAGELATCSLDRAGVVRCWGGVLGDPASPVPRYSDAHPQPRTTVLPAPAVEISVGSDHACARVADGRVFCWGDNDRGQLGDGTTTRRDQAAPVALSVAATQLSTSGHSSCALAAGRVFCWGRERGAKARHDATRPEEPAAPAR